MRPPVKNIRFSGNALQQEHPLENSHNFHWFLLEMGNNYIFHFLILLLAAEPVTCGPPSADVRTVTPDLILLVVIISYFD